MPASRLDSIYRRLLITKFFTKGWGKPENLQRLFEFRKLISNREQCYKLIPRDYPVKITKEEVWSDCRVLEGHFLTPLDRFLPDLVPEAAKAAHFQIILPLEWKDKNFKPMCLHLAGTGDHYFWRRRNIMAKPLLKEAGIGAIILENPFYGLRKPKDQVRSCLHNVTDIFVMGGCLVLESLVLFHWCERNGLGPLGVTGLSMGGHMASLAATNWPKPIVLVPCLSWSTASSVFTRGVLSQSINWELLESQYLSDGVYKDKLSKMVTIVDDAFLAGKRFIKHFNQSMQELRHDMQQHLNDVVSSKDLKLSVIKSVDEREHVQVKKVITNISNPPVDINSSELISQELISKITSDQKYELNSQEISEINKMHSAETKSINEQTTASETGYRYSIDSSQIPSYKSDICSEPNIVQYSKNCNVEVLEQNSETLIEPSINEGMKKYMGALLWKDADITKLNVNKLSWRQREAMQFMRGVMDECTHLSNFSIPYDTSLIIAVCAKDDAYVPRDNCGNLEDIWPGAEVRYVNAGHVSAYVLHQGLFRSSIKEGFQRYKQKWMQGVH